MFTMPPLIAFVVLREACASGKLSHVPKNVLAEGIVGCYYPSVVFLRSELVHSVFVIYSPKERWKHAQERSPLCSPG
jgi:hypothetical protein